MQERRNSIANALELRLSCTTIAISNFVWSSLCLLMTWYQYHYMPGHLQTQRWPSLGRECAQDKPVPNVIWLTSSLSWSDHKQATCLYIDGLVQERCNSSALAMELHLSWPQCHNTPINIYTKKYTYLDMCLLQIFTLLHFLDSSKMHQRGFQTSIQLYVYSLHSYFSWANISQTCIRWVNCFKTSEAYMNQISGSSLV